MRKIHCTLISGNALQSQFMQHADMFEKFKVLATVKRLTLTLKDGCTDERAMNDMKRMSEFGERVVAVFIPNVPDGAWYDETVKVISNGHNWRMLDEVLSEEGFPGFPEPPPAKVVTYSDPLDW